MLYLISAINNPQPTVEFWYGRTAFDAAFAGDGIPGLRACVARLAELSLSAFRHEAVLAATASLAACGAQLVLLALPVAFAGGVRRCVVWCDVSTHAGHTIILVKEHFLIMQITNSKINNFD